VMAVLSEQEIYAQNKSGVTKSPPRHYSQLNNVPLDQWIMSLGPSPHDIMTAAYSCEGSISIQACNVLWNVISFPFDTHISELSWQTTPWPAGQTTYLPVATTCTGSQDIT